MKKTELIATYLAMAVFLIGVAVLAMPTVPMLRDGGAGAVGPGTFPAIALIGITLLVVLIAIKDTLAYRLARRSEERAEASAPLNLGHTGIVMAFLIGFVLLWHYTAFPIAAPIFFIGLSLYLLLAASDRSRRWMKSILVGIAFSAGAWLIFEWALGIPLH